MKVHKCAETIQGRKLFKEIRCTILQIFYLYRTHKKEAADRRKSTVFGDQAKMIRDTFGKGVKTATDTGKVQIL